MLLPIGQRVDLPGHSAGRILALLGRQCGHRLLSLMFWEPALVVENAGHRPGTEMPAKMQSLLALEAIAGKWFGRQSAKRSVCLKARPPEWQRVRQRVRAGSHSQERLLSRVAEDSFTLWDVTTA
jgi:hypothetical protein